jgi:hypothetical protein
MRGLPDVRQENFAFSRPLADVKVKGRPGVGPGFLGDLSDLGQCDVLKITIEGAFLLLIVTRDESGLTVMLPTQRTKTDDYGIALKIIPKA